MTLSTRTITLVASAALLALAGAPAVSSAPSLVVPPVVRAEAPMDDAYRPGMDGVDVAAVTGPRGSGAGKVPACADPARRGDLRPC